MLYILVTPLLAIEYLYFNCKSGGCWDLVFRKNAVVEINKCRRPDRNLLRICGNPSLKNCCTFFYPFGFSGLGMQLKQAQKGLLYPL